MGRAEAFAGQNGPKESILDGLGNGTGFGWILITVAAVRELFGFGELFGFKIFNHEWLIGEAFSRKWTSFISSWSIYNSWIITYGFKRST